MRGAALPGALALTVVIAFEGRAAASEGAETSEARSAEPSVEAAELLTGASRCPDPASVWEAMGTLLPPERLAARLRVVAGKMPPIELADLGGAFRVIVAGRVREYRDHERDCADRARIAAVVVALAIDPAAMMTSPPASPPAPAPPSAPPAVSVPLTPSLSGSHAVRLYVGPTGDLGWGTGSTFVQGGAGLRVVTGRGRVAFSAGAAASWPVETDVGEVRVRHRRVPIDIALRGRLPGARVHTFGEVGLAASLFSLSGVTLATARTRNGYELGARASVGIELASAGRVAPFAAVQAEVVPSPPELFVLPQGSLGRTPFFWIGATIGASVGFP